MPRRLFLHFFEMTINGQQNHYVVRLLFICVVPLASSFVNKCPSSIEGLFGQDILIGCNFVSPFAGVYWFDETDDDEPLIRLENGMKIGRGYSSGEYDVTSNGSLVIRDTKWTNDMTFKVIVLDAEYQDYTFLIKVSILVKHCDILSSPSNGSVNQTAKTAKFACDPGFHLQGRHILKCHHNGDTTTYHWSGDIPRCVKESISRANTTITTTPIINSVKTSDAMSVSTGTKEDGNYIPNQVEAGPTRSNHIPAFDDLGDPQGNSSGVLRVSGGVSSATLTLLFILTFWNR